MDGESGCDSVVIVTVTVRLEGEEGDWGWGLGMGMGDEGLSGVGVERGERGEGEC